MNDKQHERGKSSSRLAHLETPPEGLSPAASGSLPRHRRQASVASEHSSIFPPSQAGSVAAQSITAAGDAHSSMPASSPIPSPRQSQAGDTTVGSLSSASPNQPAAALGTSQAQHFEPVGASSGVSVDPLAAVSGSDPAPAHQAEANHGEAGGSGRGPAAADGTAMEPLPTAGKNSAAGSSVVAPSTPAE